MLLKWICLGHTTRLHMCLVYTTTRVYCVAADYPTNSSAKQLISHIRIQSAHFLSSCCWSSPYHLFTSARRDQHLSLFLSVSSRLLRYLIVSPSESFYLFICIDYWGTWPSLSLNHFISLYMHMQMQVHVYIIIHYYWLADRVSLVHSNLTWSI